MKTLIVSAFALLALGQVAFGQKVSSTQVPEPVKKALLAKYPSAKKVTWEKEKGNFEANWGGKSGEDTAVQFTPTGVFVEEVLAMPVKDLPLSISEYVKKNYKGAKITEAGKVTDASGKKMFEAEIKGKDLVFSEEGKFIKVD